MRHFAIDLTQHIRLLALLAGLASGCTDPYLPDVVKSPPSYLVVDGFINPLGSSSFKLSRTYAVGASSAAPLETKAQVFVEDEAGSRFVLSEGPVGTYTSAAQTLSPSRRYRLHLTTLAGKEYASDYVPVKLTPVIDKLDWRAETTGLSFLVSTHDATNSTQYYRWDYVETWEIYPIYQPTVEYVNRAMRPIVTRYPTICWGNAPSNRVQLAKTTGLTQDVVSELRLFRLPTSSERLYGRYSLLVQQHALTKEEYSYWELLRKNTESLGSLFDAQPVQLTGNVHCLSSSREAVLGYVGAHSLTEKRIFITRADLPRAWPIQTGYEGCFPPDTIKIYSRPPYTKAEQDALLFAAFNQPSLYVPIEPVGTGYTGRARDCVDCRTRGTVVKPAYWP